MQSRVRQEKLSPINFFSQLHGRGTLNWFLKQFDLKHTVSYVNSRLAETAELIKFRLIQSKLANKLKLPFFQLLLVFILRRQKQDHVQLLFNVRHPKRLFGFRTEHEPEICNIFLCRQVVTKFGTKINTRLRKTSIESRLQVSE